MKTSNRHCALSMLIALTTLGATSIFASASVVLNISTDPQNPVTSTTYTVYGSKFERTESIPTGPGYGNYKVTVTLGDNSPPASEQGTLYVIVTHQDCYNLTQLLTLWYWRSSNTITVSTGTYQVGHCQFRVTAPMGVTSYNVQITAGHY